MLHLLRFPPGYPYLGHNSLALEAAADAVINTLGLAPRGIDTLVAVALVAAVVGDPSAFPFSSRVHVGRFAQIR